MRLTGGERVEEMEMKGRAVENPVRQVLNWGSNLTFDHINRKRIEDDETNETNLSC